MASKENFLELSAIISRNWSTTIEEDDSYIRIYPDSKTICCCVTPQFSQKNKTCQVNAFHPNNNLIGLHFMACIFLFLSPKTILIFEKI
jgi:hypothetical protein